MNAVKNLFGRRQLFQQGGLLAALASMPAGAKAATAGKLQLGPDIYKSLGVRPLINCRGTFTVVSGSLELPEVRASMEAAAPHFVQLDGLTAPLRRPLAGVTLARA